MKFQIQAAVADDAADAADVMRRSIETLYFADHRNDERLLTQ